MDLERLSQAIDAVVPSDSYASASEACGFRFWAAVIADERPEWATRVSAVLDGVGTDEDVAWFATMVNYAFYADPAAWAMLGWQPEPAGGWPAVVVPELDRSAVIRPDQLADHYDAVVVGSGAGAGVAACALTEAGRRVLLVERGVFPDRAYLAQDHLRNARTDTGLDHRTLPRSADDPRTLLVDGQPLKLPAWDPRWGSNAYTYGGGTRIYGAQAWRFVPEDFRMASTYGVPDGSALADWPIGDDDLEPYYSRAEWEIGVCGSTEGDSRLAYRSRSFPMPAMPRTAPAERLAAGAQALGWSVLPVPLAINSVPYAGRPGCARCRQCVGFACPIEAKNGAHNTTLARAAGTGRLHVLLGTRAVRITVDDRDRVDGVALIGEVDPVGWRARVGTADVVIGAGAIETARLLLASPTEVEPTGLGNRHDRVGRHLQGHLYCGALGIFAEEVNDWVGPGASIATNEFRHHNPGLIGGGMIANDFVPTPVLTFDYLRQAGLVGLDGQATKQAMRHLNPRMQRVVGPVQEVTSAESRVRLDPRVVDHLGIPVARLSGRLHPEDHRTQRFLGERAADWLSASGAVTTKLWPPRPDAYGPSSGQHQAGTCRMGTDPADSVCDIDGRVWGHDNLRVVDGSLHVTNGGVNPVLTIYANAMRIMDRWLGPRQ